MPNRQKYARIEDVNEVKRDVKDIKENHLPHLRTQLSRITGELYILIPLVMAILGLIVYAIMR